MQGRNNVKKVFRSLEKREVLLREATRNITSQKGTLFDFVKPSMSVDLLLLKIGLTPLAKMCFGTIRINNGSVSGRWTFKTKIYESGSTALITSKKEMEEIMKIIKSIEEFYRFFFRLKNIKE